jgi:DNA-binding response OmpR family regulator
LSRAEKMGEMLRRALQKTPSTRTILIADDERPLADALSATLDQEGLQTVVTYDGEEALTIARALRPDLILLDQDAWQIRC